MAEPTYRVHVFGKEGCQKCAMLKRRLSALLEKPEWQGFTMVYHDVLTQDGVFAFCKAACLNPNRIPAVLVAVVKEDGSDEYIPGAARALPLTDPECYRDSLPYLYTGMQTDYESGGGVITPHMLEDVLRESLTHASSTGDDGEPPDVEEQFCESCSM